MKKLSYQQLLNIYRKYAFTPHFNNTLYAAIILITVPSLTNIFYMFKPNSLFSKVVPFAMPIICLGQYFVAFKYDMENFCFKQTDDS